MKGEGPLASAWAAVRSVAPERATLRDDALAGLSGAIGAVPDGMSGAVLAGVNPVHGLYASFAGRISGGLTTSSRLMVVTTTGAAALAAGSALRNVDSADRPGALFLLTAISGIALVAAGILRFGRFTRFVPHSVMIGFLSGVAVNIACGQLPNLTGVDASGANAVSKALYVVTHPGQIDGPSLITGLAALAIVSVLARTRLSTLGALLALIIPSVFVAAVWSSKVFLVSDEGSIPTGLPLPALPHLRYFTFDLLTGAFAVAALVLVQGAGVSESVPNLDGSPSDADRDLRAQGIGNLVASALSGQPVGGSVGQTALNRAAGAKSRWGGIFSGIWLVAILLVLSEAVGHVATPTLAAVLIFAAAGALRPREAEAIFHTSSTSTVAMITTFIATLLLPVAAAVGIGLALSLMMQLNQEALDLRVVQLELLDDGRFREHPAGDALPSHEVTVLDVYGSLLYAGSRTLQAKLPDPSLADRPVVVLRLRGRTALGATFFVVVSGYAAKLAERGGKLYISGADPHLIEQMHRNGKIAVEGPVAVYEAGEVIGDSTVLAATDARTWLIEQGPHPEGPEPGDADEA
ncbi:SulP family inorganic anion transporter [Aquihabitans sp. McL0605]|uniref:SulP family inorganic anion transporter n=1 Tax=Aquihabitans sp. McL0605 TaxID=3415671 RepID=UPI003CE7D23F